MRTFIFLSITTSLFACQEQETTANINDADSRQQVETFEEYTTTLEATNAECVYGGEAHANLASPQPEDVALSWNHDDLLNPGSILAPGSGWEKQERELWIDLDAIEQHHQTHSAFVEDDLLVITTEVFEIEIELNDRSDEEVYGAWYYCPKDADHTIPGQSESEASDEDLETQASKLSGIRDPQY